MDNMTSATEPEVHNALQRRPGGGLSQTRRQRAQRT